MEERKCKDCKHFMQHYCLGSEALFGVNCGHCTLSRKRERKPDEPACAKFAAGTRAEDLFVRKEYLYKELLQRVLDMELLPEIVDKSAEELPIFEELK